jgi:crotonobetainyl-CoA:carnitine CoA-transferase CaiB-like acyl-CoA transferase
MDSGLHTLRVLEVGGGLPAAMAAKLLAELGAEVVKIEPPQGDPIRHAGPFRNGRADPETGGAHLYLDANKRSLALDLAAEDGRATLRELAGRVHLVLHGLPPQEMAACGLDYAALCADNPALVLLSITPFGLSGPYRDYAANDLTLIHGGGWGWLCPGKSTPPEREPIKPFGQHALVQAGLHAAVAALAAVYGAAASGVGEHLDVSVQEVVTFVLGRHFAVYPFAGRTDSRLSPAAYEPMSFYPCKDGSVFLICPEQAQFDRLVALMGTPDWVMEPRFATRDGRQLHARELKERLSQWTAQWEAMALYHACQAVRVGAAPVFTQAQLEQDEHLHAREFFVAHTHPRAGALRLPGAPYRLKRPQWAPRRPAPVLGEANGVVNTLFTDRRGSPRVERGEARAPFDPQGALPLAGVRVLDLSWVWAGPHCTMMLGLLGAEVIKVESSNRLDLTRRSHLFAADLEPGPNRCGYFHQINQGKLGIGVDLSQPEGVALVQRLAEQSDVMISNFGTGVLERLGLGSEAMQRRNPRLICALISAFGQTGPCRHYMGYGPLISPLAGISSATGYPGGPPEDVGLAYGDPNGGVYTAVAILAALLTREADGAGQVIDLSMWEAMLCTGFEGWMNHALGNAPYAPMGNRHPTLAPHNVYRCAGEDAWVAIAAESPAQWQALCAAIGQPALAQDARFRAAAARKAHEDALDALLGAWCAAHDKWEVTRVLQSAGVPALPSLDSRELHGNPHLLAREAFTHWPHREVGVRPMMGPPWRFARRPNGLGKAAPCLGEDTDAVLERLLGLDAEARAALRARGAIE